MGQSLDVTLVPPSPFWHVLACRLLINKGFLQQLHRLLFSASNLQTFARLSQHDFSLSICSPAGSTGRRPHLDLAAVVRADWLEAMLRKHFVCGVHQVAMRRRLDDRPQELHVRMRSLRQQTLQDPASLNVRQKRALLLSITGHDISVFFAMTITRSTSRRVLNDFQLRKMDLKKCITIQRCYNYTEYATLPLSPTAWSAIVVHFCSHL